jgi:hypothetical protein
MKLAEMTIIRAAITEKAAGEVATELREFDGTGRGEEGREERLILQQAEKVAWRGHHRAAYEATKRFLKKVSK